MRTLGMACVSRPAGANKRLTPESAAHRRSGSRLGDRADARRPSVRRSCASPQRGAVASAAARRGIRGLAWREIPGKRARRRKRMAMSRGDEQAGVKAASFSPESAFHQAHTSSACCRRRCCAVNGRTHCRDKILEIRHHRFVVRRKSKRGFLLTLPRPWLTRDAGRVNAIRDHGSGESGGKRSNKNLIDSPPDIQRAADGTAFLSRPRTTMEHFGARSAGASSSLARDNAVSSGGARRVGPPSSWQASISQRAPLRQASPPTGGHRAS